MKVRAWVDVVCNARRDDRQDIGGALGAFVEPRGEPILAGTSGCYTDHARRYSKGRRRAPLYTWLGTAPGAFGVMRMVPAAAYRGRRPRGPRRIQIFRPGAMWPSSIAPSPG